MSTPSTLNLRDNFNVIWTIAAKDIVDAVKNKTVVSMAIMLSLIILMPKMLPFIFEQPQTVLPIYDPGNSSRVAEMDNPPDFSVQKLRSVPDLTAALCGGMYPQIGLHIPEDFDVLVAAGGQIELQGYVCWNKRHQVSSLQLKLEDILSQTLGQPVTIQLDGNIVYPPTEGVLFTSMATINSVLMILMMGTFLVPTLILDEKETKTLQALLVSPASINQVVIGKALAGFFYILVTAVMIFAISWIDVIHWNMVLLFVISGGFLSVAIGLVLGSFFEKQQEMIGGMTVLLIFMISAIFVKTLGIDVPPLVGNILSWIPSVALSEINQAAFRETYSLSQILVNLGIVMTVSLILYAIVIWKVRRSDR